MNGIANKRINANRISFFGDSLTRGIPGAAFFEILENRLPEYELVNYGKGGDTVISLYRRIKNSQLDQNSDIAFLWIGTNDVFVKISGSYPVFKTIVNQPWVRNTEEFERYYRMTLEILCQYANKVITIPPLFMGEDIKNRWNKEMECLSIIIEQLSYYYENVEYLNLRKLIVPQLDGKILSSYLPTSIVSVGIDTLLLKRKDQVDKKSIERGLFYTLDGVHLNSAGAKLVAEAFLEIIKNPTISKGKTIENRYPP
jgi:lysophospholipase L1-like esterase